MLSERVAELLDDVPLETRVHNAVINHRVLHRLDCGSAPRPDPPTGEDLGLRVPQGKPLAMLGGDLDKLQTGPFDELGPLLGVELDGVPHLPERVINVKESLGGALGVGCPRFQCPEVGI